MHDDETTPETRDHSTIAREPIHTRLARRLQRARSDEGSEASEWALMTGLGGGIALAIGVIFREPLLDVVRNLVSSLSGQ